MSANAHKPIIAILILLVASFSSAHAAPHSGASAVNLVAPPPPSPNSYPAALYTVGSQRSEEHTSELQSRLHLVCRLLLEKKKTTPYAHTRTAPLSDRT